MMLPIRAKKEGVFRGAINMDWNAGMMVVAALAVSVPHLRFVNMGCV
jgi:hypothetical protein